MIVMESTKRAGCVTCFYAESLMRQRIESFRQSNIDPGDRCKRPRGMADCVGVDMQETTPRLSASVKNGGAKKVRFICIHCGVEAETTNRGPTRPPKYCSRSCANVHQALVRDPWNKQQVERPCQWCGQPVILSPVHIRLGHRKFCSRQCWAKWRVSTGYTHPCQSCGTQYTAPSPRAKWCPDCEGRYRRDALMRRARTGMTLRDFADRTTYLRLISSDPCVYCGADGETIEHILPVSLGGTDRWDNLAPACGRCNCSKNDKTLLRFLLINPIGSR